MLENMGKNFGQEIQIVLQPNLKCKELKVEVVRGLNILKNDHFNDSLLALKIDKEQQLC